MRMGGWPWLGGGAGEEVLGGGCGEGNAGGAGA